MLKAPTFEQLQQEMMQAMRKARLDDISGFYMDGGFGEHPDAEKARKDNDESDKMITEKMSVDSIIL